jgi:aldehyde:ferredoxin oxidoreductase
MFKFTKTTDSENKYDISNVEVSLTNNNVTATQLAEEFGKFLLASGFGYELVKSVLAEDIEL